MTSRSSKTTCQICKCGGCPDEPLTGTTRGCIKANCFNRMNASHFMRMKSAMCMDCEEKRFSSQSTHIADCEEKSSKAIEWAGVSLQLEDIVRCVDNNSNSKDRLPKIENDDLFTYVQNLKDAFLETRPESKGYIDLSAEDFDLIKDSINGSPFQFWASWTERFKGVLFRRVHAFIMTKLGKY
jgi:hypothetical protein